MYVCVRARAHRHNTIAHTHTAAATAPQHNAHAVVGTVDKNAREPEFSGLVEVAGNA